MKYIILGMVLLTLGSCTKESAAIDETPDIGGKVRIQLITNAGNYERPETRIGSALENSVDATPWVFVFSGSDNNAIFSEVQQSIVLDGKTFVILTKTTTACRILVIANAPANFQDASGTSFSFDQNNLTAQLTGKTLTAAVANLLTSPQLASPQTTVPYTPDLAIPMSALMPVVAAINENTVINSTGVAGGSALPINRIVAKVTVDASEVINTFTLSGATVVGAPRNGALADLGIAIKSNAGNLTDYLTSTTGDGVTGIAPATNNTTVANPIYLYESQERATSVIIKGTYNGIVGYYRLVFMGPTQLVNVYRNKYYLFTITSVTDSGYPTVAEAIANPASNAIKVTLSVTDLNSFDILDNGQYYLGVSNSSLNMLANQLAYNGIPAVTVTTNASSPNTLSAIGSGGITAVVPAPTIIGNITSWNVTMSVTAAFTSGTITLKIGNIVKTIAVTRATAAVGAIGGLISSATPIYVGGQVNDASVSWLSLSSINDSSTGGATMIAGPNPGPYYLFATANNTGVDRVGIVYLTRYDRGRLMLYIVQAH
ncbi:hypothetical protein [Dysgonomonas alginatilytica]|uniref:hypothetical protein n=1 Tax=Dysgonomonas alginatilytica TaxID=1605892 RepID=UPI001C881A72|nr:hypothetical protein [Dysgonomonas alginatilytica]